MGDLLGELRTLEAQNRALTQQCDSLRRQNEDLAATLERQVEQRTAELREANAALGRSEARFRSLVEGAGDAIFIIDAKGSIADVNQQACRSLNRERGALIGLLVNEVEVGLSLEELKRIHQSVGSKPLNAEPLSVNGVHLRKDGTKFPVEVRITAIPGHDGTGIELMVLARDVSERRRLESQFLQAQKMESIGRLAGGVAHDFNNLLTTITGYCDLLLSDQPADGQHEELEQILEASRRASGLTQQLLAFSRRQRLELKPIDLVASVREGARMLARIIGADIHIDLRLPNHEVVVCADPSQMQQVLLNLAVNSRDAMPHGGNLVIEVTEQHLQQASSAPNAEPRATRYATLTVADDGEGMSPEAQSHLFEPFFTTKAQGKGTGLGLATVYGIVNQHSGRITVDSALDRGTTVRILIPSAEARSVRPISVRPSQLPNRGTERLLVVDDSDGVRRFLRDGLNRLGYRVTLAPNGADAVTWLKSYRKDVDLVISDIVMPVMGGIELMSHIASDFPGLPTILMSGYLEDHPGLEETLARGIRLLRKPLSLIDVAAAIRAALDR